MEPGKRIHKSASLRVAVPTSLPVDMQEKIRELVSVQSSTQGRGDASALMWQVCSEADRARLVLIVKPEVFGPGLTLEKLLKFYEKFGFTEIQQQPCVLLARQPERVARIAHGV